MRQKNHRKLSGRCTCTRTPALRLIMARLNFSGRASTYQIERARVPVLGELTTCVSRGCGTAQPPDNLSFRLLTNSSLPSYKPSLDPSTNPARTSQLSYMGLRTCVSLSRVRDSSAASAVDASRSFSSCSNRGIKSIHEQLSTRSCRVSAQVADAWYT